MEFDWSASLLEISENDKIEVEESFEDPFSLRLLPDAPRYESQNRYFALGRSGSGAHVFSVYRSNGKQIQIIACRPMAENERYFYDLKVRQSLSGEARP